MKKIALLLCAATLLACTSCGGVTQHDYFATVDLNEELEKLNSSYRFFNSCKVCDYNSNVLDKMKLNGDETTFKDGVVIFKKGDAEHSDVRKDTMIYACKMITTNYITDEILMRDHESLMKTSIRNCFRITDTQIKSEKISGNLLSDLFLENSIELLDGTILKLKIFGTENGGLEIMALRILPNTDPDYKTALLDCFNSAVKN